MNSSFNQFRVLFENVWPSADRYYLLLFTLQIIAFRCHIFFFQIFCSIFLISYSDIYIHIVLYIFIYFVVRYWTNSASDVIGIDSQPVDFRGSMLLSRFVVDLECKPRYETKLSDQVNLFDSRMGEGRRGRNGGQTNKGKTKTRERSRSLFLGRVVLAYSWHVSRVLSPPFRFVIPSAPKDFQSLPLS